MTVEMSYADYVSIFLERNRCRIRPEITSHSFKNGLTIITWSDGTRTKCYCNPEKADEYTGFMICLAKKAFGNDNTASNLADKWLVKIPKREAEHKAKEDAEKKEQERIAANKAKKREIKRKKRMIREEARRIKEEYERDEIKSAAESLAVKEYGVPSDYVWSGE